MSKKTIRVSKKGFGREGVTAWRRVLQSLHNILIEARNPQRPVMSLSQKAIRVSMKGFGNEGVMRGGCYEHFGHSLLRLVIIRDQSGLSHRRLSG